MYPRAAVLLLLVAVILPASGASPHLEPGTLVDDGAADRGALVLLHVLSGHKDAQSVYVVRPVARCDDPGGPGWYAPAAVHELRSAPELEGRQRLGTLDPTALPAACANPVPEPLPPHRETGWEMLMEGTLNPFGPLTFPRFGAPMAHATGGGSPDDGVRQLVTGSHRPPVAGA